MYCRRLDKLIPDVVCWIPYGDHRSFREFEVIFLIFNHLRWCPLMAFTDQRELYDSLDMPQQLVAAMTPDEIDVDVHRPQHAVDGYVAIVDKLERLLNLRILTEGTEAYIVAEECLSIARSYIGQPTVGHRSRRRRRTDDH
ncbi:hypothetical protein GmHk_13G036919 [Glycine max]|nr:hypothetical protein GmHk_13G036919 [Glycine max]